MKLENLISQDMNHDVLKKMCTSQINSSCIQTLHVTVSIIKYYDEYTYTYCTRIL
jgi:hypothetical protein